MTATAEETAVIEVTSCATCGTPLVPSSPPASPYQTGASVRTDHPELSIYAADPVREPTAEEAAEYARRATDPGWADIYRAAEYPVPDVSAVHAPPVDGGAPTPAADVPADDPDDAADRAQHDAQEYLTRLGANTADLQSLARE